MGTGIILCMRPANERWHYNVTSSVIGWVHTQNDPCGNSHDLEDFFSLQYKCLTDKWRLFFFYWGSSHWIISTSSVVIPIRKRPCLFSCDQAALRTLLSVRLSFCPSVRPSVTPFSLCSHHHIIMKFSGVITNDMQKVEVIGQRSRSQRSKPNLAVSGL